MFAVIINVFAIVFGCMIGLILKRGIPESVSDSLMKGLVHRTRNNWTRSTQDEFSAARRRSEA